MKKYPSFKIDFLNRNIVIILDNNWLQIAGEILDKDLTNDEQFTDSNAIAFAKGNNYYVAAPKKVKDATLYHECFHVLMEICDDFDIKLDYGNHEFGAYAIEYLIEETLKIKKWKK